jgi:SAM-dependent methyltransferase
MDHAPAWRAITDRLPTRGRVALKTVVRAVRRFAHAGDRIRCPICDGRYGSFVGREDRANAQCPGCGSFVRHRILWLYLRDVIGVADHPMRVLHLAPESAIERHLRAIPSIDYVTADADAALATDRVDIVSLPYGNAAFDLVICSHVLEHVPNDRAAIAELRRVLRPGGTAIVIVPVHLERTVEFLDERSVPEYPDGYLRAEHGHVREIGADYPDRLRAAGFRVDVLDYAASLPQAARSGMALEPSEPLFICT